MKNDHIALWTKDPFLSLRGEQRHRCADINASARIDLTRMVYDDRHKVVMCVVPKVRKL